jgi:hypothetical protein
MRLMAKSAAEVIKVGQVVGGQFALISASQSLVSRGGRYVQGEADHHTTLHRSILDFGLLMMNSGDAMMSSGKKNGAGWTLTPF